MKRIVSALLVLFGLLTVSLPAVAAPEGEYEQFDKDYWFGRVSLENTNLGPDGFFTTFEIENDDLAYPLPFQSFLTADLYDCQGRVARSVYGDMTSVKQPGRPWMTTGSVTLNLPPKGGPYAAWVVRVRSKGRPAETFSVTDGGAGFTLDCDGGYRRNKETFWAPQYDAPRPLNAAFGESVPAILRKVARSFGRPTGRARVGSTVNVVGARDVSGKPSCGLNLTVSWPQRPSLEPDQRGTSCGPYGIRIERTYYFKKRRADGSFGTVNSPARGKRVVLDTSFFVHGHRYRQEFDFGLVK